MKNMRFFIWMIFFTVLVVVNCTEVSSDDVPDCSRSFCGCWQDMVLKFSTKILSKQNQPLTDIEVYCAGEKTPRSISDQAGMAAFNVSTQYSPGCHYAICSNLIFKDKSQTYKEQQFTVYQANGQSIHLTRAK